MGRLLSTADLDTANISLLLTAEKSHALETQILAKTTIKQSRRSFAALLGCSETFHRNRKPQALVAVVGNAAEMRCTTRHEEARM